MPGSPKETFWQTADIMLVWPCECTGKAVKGPLQAAFLQKTLGKLKLAPLTHVGLDIPPSEQDGGDKKQ